MKTYNAKSVFDLDQFLPSDGEDSVELIYKDGSLFANIFYVDATLDQSMVLSIEFKMAFYFIKSSIPGFSVFSYQQVLGLDMLGSLIEYDRSEWVSSINQSTRLEGLKHYRIMLHSTGTVLDVACISWLAHEAIPTLL